MYSRADWIRFSLIALTYSAIFHLCWLFSLSFMTIPDTVSWYLPAGIRMCAFLLLPFRAWPFLYLVERGSFVVILELGLIPPNLHYYEPTALWLTIHFALAPMVYLALIWWYRKMFTLPYLNNLRSTMWLLPLFLATSFVNGVLFLGRLAFINQDLADRFADMLTLFVLGDLVGIATVLPILMVIREWWVTREFQPGLGELYVVLFWMLFVVAVMASNDFQLDMNNYVKIIAIFPTVYFSYRLGWHAAAISVLFISGMAFYSAYESASSTTENMFYIIFMGVTSMFLGAAMSELKLITKALRRSNMSLNQSNLKLNAVVEANRQLSSHAMDMLEQERKRLSQDLHDDFGQRITDIKLTASYARGEHFQLAEHMEKIMYKADQLYSSLKYSIGELHPQGLNDVGLKDYLEKGDLALLTKEHGIRLQVESDADLPQLTEVQAISLYRICQESINNALKHAEASCINIQFSVKPSQLRLTISDNGIGFHTEQNFSGLGLKFMQERAASLNGTTLIQSDSNGTKVQVSIPLIPDE